MSSSGVHAEGDTPAPHASAASHERHSYKDAHAECEPIRIPLQRIAGAPQPRSVLSDTLSVSVHHSAESSNETEIPNQTGEKFDNVAASSNVDAGADEQQAPRRGDKHDGTILSGLASAFRLLHSYLIRRKAEIEPKFVELTQFYRKHSGASLPAESAPWKQWELAVQYQALMSCITLVHLITPGLTKSLPALKNILPLAKEPVTEKEFSIAFVAGDDILSNLARLVFHSLEDPRAFAYHFFLHINSILANTLGLPLHPLLCPHIAPQAVVDHATEQLLRASLISRGSGVPPASVSATLYDSPSAALTAALQSVIKSLILSRPEDESLATIVSKPIPVLLATTHRTLLAPALSFATTQASGNGLVKFSIVSAPAPVHIHTAGAELPDIDDIAFGRLFGMSPNWIIQCLNATTADVAVLVLAPHAPSVHSFGNENQTILEVLSRPKALVRRVLSRVLSASTEKQTRVYVHLDGSVTMRSSVTAISAMSVANRQASLMYPKDSLSGNDTTPSGNEQIPCLNPSVPLNLAAARIVARIISSNQDENEELCSKYGTPNGPAMEKHPLTSVISSVSLSSGALELLNAEWAVTMGHLAMFSQSDSIDLTYLVHAHRPVNAAASLTTPFPEAQADALELLYRRTYRGASASDLAMSSSTGLAVVPAFSATSSSEGIFTPKAHLNILTYAQSTPSFARMFAHWLRFGFPLIGLEYCAEMSKNGLNSTESEPESDRVRLSFQRAICSLLVPSGFQLHARYTAFLLARLCRLRILEEFKARLSDSLQAFASRNAVLRSVGQESTSRILKIIEVPGIEWSTNSVKSDKWVNAFFSRFRANESATETDDPEDSMPASDDVLVFRFKLPACLARSPDNPTPAWALDCAPHFVGLDDESFNRLLAERIFVQPIAATQTLSDVDAERAEKLLPRFYPALCASSTSIHRILEDNEPIHTPSFTLDLDALSLSTIFSFRSAPHGFKDNMARTAIYELADWLALAVVAETSLLVKTVTKGRATLYRLMRPYLPIFTTSPSSAQQLPGQPPLPPGAGLGNEQPHSGLAPGYGAHGPIGGTAKYTEAALSAGARVDWVHPSLLLRDDVPAVKEFCNELAQLWRGETLPATSQPSQNGKWINPIWGQRSKVWCGLGAFRVLPPYLSERYADLFTYELARRLHRAGVPVRLACALTSEPHPDLMPRLLGDSDQLRKPIIGPATKWTSELSVERKFQEVLRTDTAVGDGNGQTKIALRGDLQKTSFQDGSMPFVTLVIMILPYERPSSIGMASTPDRQSSSSHGDEFFSTILPSGRVVKYAQVTRLTSPKHFFEQLFSVYHKCPLPKVAQADLEGTVKAMIAEVDKKRAMMAEDQLPSVSPRQLVEDPLRAVVRTTSYVASSWPVSAAAGTIGGILRSIPGVSSLFSGWGGNGERAAQDDDLAAHIGTDVAAASKSPTTSSPTASAQHSTSALSQHEEQEGGSDTDSMTPSLTYTWSTDDEVATPSTGVMPSSARASVITNAPWRYATSSSMAATAAGAAGIRLPKVRPGPVMNERSTRSIAPSTSRSRDAEPASLRAVNAGCRFDLVSSMLVTDKDDYTHEEAILVDSDEEKALANQLSDEEVEDEDEELGSENRVLESTPVSTTANATQTENCPTPSSPEGVVASGSRQEPQVSTALGRDSATQSTSSIPKSAGPNEPLSSKVDQPSTSPIKIDLQGSGLNQLQSTELAHELVRQVAEAPAKGLEQLGLDKILAQQFGQDLPQESQTEPKTQPSGKY